MNKELEVVTIEDKEYTILKEKKHNDTTYFYLSNLNDEEDTLIRKSTKEDEDLLIPLSNDKEFDLAAGLLIKDYIK
jgi:hypothetical protein